MRTHKEELAASKSRLTKEVAALKSCRNRNASLREEISRLQEKLKTQIEREEKRHTHVVTETSETSARGNVSSSGLGTICEISNQDIDDGAEETEGKGLGPHLRCNGRAKRFDQDMKKSIHTERERVEKLRVATESISEAVVAMFAALLAGNARLHKGLRREDDQEKKKKMMSGHFESDTRKF